MKRKLIIDGNTVEINEIVNRNCELEFILDGQTYKFNTKHISNGETIVTGEIGAHVIHDGKEFVVDGKNIDIALPSRNRDKSNSEHAGSMISPMPGKILKVLVSTGDIVSKGQALVVMEAMKMEHTIKASDDGNIKAIHYKENDLVDGGVDLVDLEIKE
jgi:3-methylcrotonyl-CoA carboxylase alpha subunit